MATRIFVAVFLWMEVVGALSVSKEKELFGPELRSNENTNKIVCYFTNWSQYYRGLGRYTVENIDPFLCTHINYAFASIHGLQLSTTDRYDHELYEQLNNLKTVNPDLKTLLSVGGYKMGPIPFERVCHSLRTMTAFAENVIKFLRINNFDGVDLDWEYPSSYYKDSYTELLKVMREQFELEAASTSTPPLLLTVALSGSVHQMYSSYDLGKMHHYLDFANVMTYDYHGYWGTSDVQITVAATGLHSALYGMSDSDQLCQDWTFNAYMDEGFPSQKFILGIPVYGRSFTLCDESDHGLGAMACGPGHEGRYTNEDGILAYYEICHELTKDPGYTIVYDSKQKGPYAYKGDQWFGFDNMVSTIKKVEYAHKNSLGGVMFWDLAKDDFHNWCQNGHYPNVRQGRNAANLPLSTTPATTPSTTPSTTQPTTTISTTTTPTTTTTTTAAPSTTTKATSALPSTTSSTTAQPSTTTTATTTKSTTTTTTSPNLNITGLPLYPPSEIECEFDNQLHPHPIFCRVYYRCSHGIPYVFFCPAGLCFDPFINTCNWPAVMENAYYAAVMKRRAHNRKQKQ